MNLADLKAKAEATRPIEAPGQGLPPIVCAKDFRQSKIIRPPEIIKGVLTQGARMVLAGPSKSRKSWTLLDLCYSVASGSPWMTIPTTKSKTLYANFELRNHTIHDRINRISQARKIANDDLLDLWDLRGHASDIENMVHHLLHGIGDRQYGLIVLDPTYKLLGDRDENAAGQMTEFCSHLEWLSQASGAAVVAAAHFPKGAMAGRISQDRIAGSGAFARDADAILTMTPHDDSTEENPCFTIESTLREFAPISPFVVRWDYPLMAKHSADPKKIQNKPGPKTTYDDSELLKFVPAEGISKLDWRKKVQDETGISKTVFYGRIKELLKYGAIVEDDKGLVKRGNPANRKHQAALAILQSKGAIGGYPVAVNGFNAEEDEDETDE